MSLWKELSAGSSCIGTDRVSSPGSELPRSDVVFADCFRMAAVAVTNLQYQAFDPSYELYDWRVPVDGMGSKVGDAVLRCYPAVKISWYEATSFCRWLSSSLAWCEGARLPTEEEWEYACRAGTTSEYWNGNHEDELSAVGWYDKNSDHRPHSVGRKASNPWGLFDMHGGVWEWTASAFDRTQERSETNVEPGAAGNVSGSGEQKEHFEVTRTMRGGSCWDDALSARASFRLEGVPSLQIQSRGFRVLLPALEGESSRPEGSGGA
ncbi:MAG: formylglycine-generating enzyme family protein [bacterium]|nr:formylglycine-generating enzyme family protein [bacterium]